MEAVPPSAAPSSGRIPHERRLVVGLGANLGDRLASIRGAFDALQTIPGLRLAARSSVWQTKPVGGPLQADYLNAAALAWSPLPARALLLQLLEIERRFGRVRSERNAPRTLDLDLLWIENEAVDEPDLHVPHPRLFERAFALAPLVEVAPDARDPLTGELYVQVLSGLSQAAVRRIASPSP